jgi:glutathione S-transferase
MGTLYVDAMSQPCRAVMIFRRAAGLTDVREELVNIAKGGTRAPAFLTINPLGKVPALREDDGFTLAESGAIMRYIADARGGAAARWYPAADRRARARVDAALDWHASALRTPSRLVAWHSAIAPSLGLPANPALVADFALPTLREALRALEDVWLRGDAPFLAGDDFSIADLQVASELEQHTLLDAGPDGPGACDALFAPFPRVRAWRARVARAAAPHYEEVHAVLRRARERMVLKRGASKL